ncbi:MAG: phage tail tape measure protein [Bacteroidales bacterium]|nr:phage tail tape measure protein [Bacteroidales bacterium]MBR6904723.1 phage tail tape measure protein [Bacteroidales bacterium]
MAKGAVRSVNIYVNNKDAKKSIDELRKKIEKEKEAWELMAKGTHEYYAKAAEISRMNDVLKRENELIQSSIDKQKKRLENIGMIGSLLSGLAQTVNMFGQGLQKVRDLAADMAGLDDAMGRVRKTTMLTREEVSDLNTEFSKIDTRTSREELNELAYAAGKLGVQGKDDILGFVRAADVIKVALGDVLGGTDAIIEVTKLAQVFKGTTREIQNAGLEETLIRTGSVINELGKTSTANEGQIEKFLMRIASYASIAGMSLDQMAGLGSVLSQNSKAPEMSATAVTKIMQQMIKKTGSFAEMIGMGEKELSDLMAKDFNQAFLAVLQKLHDIGDVQAIVPIFKDLGADATRASQVILALSTNIDRVREAQETANKAIKEGTSMNKEYSVMNETMQAQMEKAKKTVFDARVELGEKLYPYIIKYTFFGGKVIKWLAKVTDHAENAWMAIGAAGMLAINKVRKNWDNLKNSFNEIGIVQEYKGMKAAQNQIKMAQEQYREKEDEIAMVERRRVELQEQVERSKKREAAMQENLKDLEAQREAVARGSDARLKAEYALNKQIEISKRTSLALEEEISASAARTNTLKKSLHESENRILGLKMQGKASEAEMNWELQNKARIENAIATEEQRQLLANAQLTKEKALQKSLEAQKNILASTTLTKEEKIAQINEIIAVQEKDLLRTKEIEAGVRSQIVNLMQREEILKKKMSGIENEIGGLKEKANLTSLLKNHWMLIATIAAEVLMLIIKIVRESRELERIHKETAVEMEKEKDRAERLFNALENVNTTEEQRAEIMKTLNDKYGKYLANLTNEEGKLWNIEAAHRAVIKAIEDEAAAKGFQKAKDKLTDEYMGEGNYFGSNLTEIQNGFEKILLKWVKNPDEKDRAEAARNANKIAEALRNGSSNEEIKALIGTMGYTKNIDQLLNTRETFVAGKGMKGEINTLVSLSESMDRYRETFSEFNEKLATEAARYGVNLKSGTEKLAADLKELRKYESDFQSETSKMIKAGETLQNINFKSSGIQVPGTENYAPSATNASAAAAEALAYKKRSEMTGDIVNMIIAKLFDGKTIDQTDKETRKAALTKLESEGIKLLGDDVAEMGEEVADMFTNAAAMVTARIRNASHSGGNGSYNAGAGTDDYDPNHPVTSGKKSGKTPEERWADLMKKSAKLNDKAVVESLGISNAKESVIKAYDAILKEVEAFNGTYEGFKEKADAEIARLEQEKWNEIARIEEEEHKKRLQKIDDNLASVTEKLKKFQLKQHRKTNTQLDTDIEEIENDFTRLREKTEQERQKLQDRKDAGNVISAMFDISDSEFRNSLMKHYKDLLSKFNITEETWANAMKHNPKDAQSLLTLLGIEFTDEDAAKLDEIISKIDELDTAKIAEIQTLATERSREIVTAMSDTATRQYREAMKTVEDQIKTLEAAQKYLSEHNDGGKNDEQLAEIERTLAFLNGQKSDLQTKYETGFGKDTWATLFGITKENWAAWSQNWEDNLAKMTDRLKTFADNVFELWEGIDSIMRNQAEAEQQRTEELYDSKSEALKRQLDSGIISQKRYDAQMERLQKEKEKKEKKLKHDEFERERAANLIQGAINLALTISSIYANEPGGVIIKSAAAAVAAAIQAVQIAAIASQPNPYAHGGYIKGKQYAVMGEQGPEWVASNRLLSDRETADIIAALDEYQKGDTRALERISFPEPDLKTVSQSVRRTGGNFAPSNQITNIYNQDTGNDEMLQELKKLNGYMSDPMNRRSYISREIQLEFEAQEREVREMARL